MTFLRARRNELTQAFWDDLAADSGDAPAILRELTRGPSVVCDRAEAEAAIEWAQRHPMWREDKPAVVIVDS